MTTPGRLAVAALALVALLAVAAPAPAHQLAYSNSQLAACAAATPTGGDLATCAFLICRGRGQLAYISCINAIGRIAAEHRRAKEGPARRPGPAGGRRRAR